MGQPNPFLPAAPQQPQGNPYQQQPAAPAVPVNPYTQPQPAQGTNAYHNPMPQQPQPQYAPQQQAAPARNGLVARPGQYTTPPPPSEGGGGGLPKVADLQGRLLIILPESIQRQIPSRFMNNGVPSLQDKLTATVIVLDGGPLSWTPKQGGVMGQPRTEQVPFVIKGLWIVQSKLIEQLEEPLAMRQRGEAGLALGRLWKTGPSNSDPYVLAQPSPQDAAMYDQYVSQVNPFAL